MSKRKKKIKKFGSGTEFKRGGLKLVPPDGRNFKLGNVFKLPPLKDLPDSFEIPTPEAWNQDNPDTQDYCAAYGADLMSFIQENENDWQSRQIDEPDHRWTFAVAKMIEGEPESWGLTPISVLKAITKYGYVTKKETEGIVFENSNDNRFIEKWPKELFDKAAPRKKKSYFQITGQYDAFDNIRASIFLFAEKKQLASLGVMWAWPLSQEIMEEPLEQGYGHFLVIKGWQKDEIKADVYSIIQNSYGLSAGRKGTHLFSRKIINTFVEKWGSYMLVDLDKNAAETLNKHKWTTKWLWLAKLINFFKLSKKNS